MAQISLYFDDQSSEQLKDAASDSGVSVSKWVRKVVQDSLNDSWPPHFFNLFGSVMDSTFCEAEELSFSEDTERESL
jgi:hypothetical protein